MVQLSKNKPTLVVSEMQRDLCVICVETKGKKPSHANNQYFSL